MKLVVKLCSTGNLFLVLKYYNILMLRENYQYSIYCTTSVLHTLFTTVYTAHILWRLYISRLRRSIIWSYTIKEGLFPTTMNVNEPLHDPLPYNSFGFVPTKDKRLREMLL